MACGDDVKNGTYETSEQLCAQMPLGKNDCKTTVSRSNLYFLKTIKIHSNSTTRENDRREECKFSAFDDSATSPLLSATRAEQE